MNDLYSKWLLVSDIDGTLNNKKRKLPHVNKTAVNDFINSGGNFTLCSGRNLKSLTPHFLNLGIETPAIFLNGAGIYDFKSHKMLAFKPFSAEAEKVLADTAKRFIAVDLTLFSPDTLYIVKPFFFGVFAAKLDKLQYKICRDGTGFDSGNIGKATFFGMPSTLGKIRSEICGNNRNLFDCFLTSPYTLEVVSAGVNKGAAVKELAGLLNIPLENTAAVGDYYNDIDMLKAVSHPVCCAQAPQEIKDLCEHIACHCNNGAVADFINYIETKYIK